jgi:ABC-type sugar transport system substrate-binding protein
MAVQNYDYYPIVDPDTYLNEQQEKLTAEQFEKNKQKLLSGIASVGYDVSPVVGEIRSLQYAQDEAKNLVENVLSGNPDKLKMVAQGAGIGLGILGAIPIVGYGTRLVNRGLQKAFEAFGPGAKAEEAVARTEGRSTTDVAQSLHEGLLTTMILFSQTFVKRIYQSTEELHMQIISESMKIFRKLKDNLF